MPTDSEWATLETSLGGYLIAASKLKEIGNDHWLSPYNIDATNESCFSALRKVKTFALKALELNENLANAHSLLGNVKMFFDYDFVGAGKEYLRAIEIDPNNSKAQIYYANYLSTLGRYDEAVSYANSSQKLDPHSKLIMTQRLNILFNSGAQEEALELAENARDSDPSWFNWYWRCAVFYTELGRYKDALSMLESQLELMEDDNISDEVGLLGYLYAKLGQIDNAQKQLDRLDEQSARGLYITEMNRFMIILGLGNFDEAIESLEKSYNNRTLYFVSFELNSSRVYDPIRNDPRFIELRKKIGLLQ